MMEPCRGESPSRGHPDVGKTTFGQELAHRLGVSFIELDALHHGPNWSEPIADEFRTRVRAVLDAATDGWVVDGNYDSKLGDTVISETDTIVWLDFPLWVTLPRLWSRTMYRLRNDVELWNGNREAWRDRFASRQSLFIWSVRSHVRHRRQWPSRFGDNPRLVRLCSVAEARRWLEAQETKMP